MNEYFQTYSTERHLKLIGTLFGRLLNLIEKNEVTVLHSDGALVHWGDRFKGFSHIELIDIEKIENKSEFIENTLNDLNYVEPDFMMFKNNQFVCNKKRNRFAGYPDLIIEIWSENNYETERNSKVELYSTSDTIEHWYIDHDSDDVHCYVGKNKIANQSLKDVLITQDEIEFDLRYLAIEK